MSSLYIVSPLSNLSKRTRLNKLVNFWMKNKSEDIVHICWEREKGESLHDEFKSIDKKIILTGGGYQGNKVRFMYLLWVIKVFFYSWSIPKGSTVWCLGFESTFPLMIASKIKKLNIIYDDADRFSMIFRMPNFIRRLVEKMEILCSANVTWHVVPGFGRYDIKTDKMVEVPNVPSLMNLDKARKYYESNRWEKSKLIINANGWLSDSRGIDLLYNVVSKFSKHEVVVYISGKLSSKSAIKLSKLPNSIYLGHVSNHIAIASCFASDFVFTFYDPSVEINRNAESNKWGDAIMTGCGIIVNSELYTIKKHIENKTAITSEYDYESLYQLVYSLVKNGNLKSEFKINSSLAENKMFSFESYLEKLL